MRILIHLMFILIISCNFTGINKYAFRRIHTVQPLTLQNVDTVCCGSDILDRKWYMVQCWMLDYEPSRRIVANDLISNRGLYASVDLFPMGKKNYFLLRSNGLEEEVRFDVITGEEYYSKGVFQIMGCQFFEFWEENKDDKSRPSDDIKRYLYCNGSDLFEYTFVSGEFVIVDLYTSLTNLKKSEENILTNKNYVYENFRQFLKQHYPYDYQLVTIEYGNGKEKVTILDER